MAFQQYLAEEVAIDHADGLYSRREALRRLTLLGVGVPAASALLAACGGDGEPVSSTTTGAGQAATPPTPAVETEEISFPGPEGRTVRGAWAAAPVARPVLLRGWRRDGLLPRGVRCGGRRCRAAAELPVPSPCR